MVVYCQGVHRIIVLDNKDNDLKLLINIADLIDDGRLDKYKMMH